MTLWCWWKRIENSDNILNNKVDDHASKGRFVLKLKHVSHCNLEFDGLFWIQFMLNLIADGENWAIGQVRGRTSDCQ